MARISDTQAEPEKSANPDIGGDLEEFAAPHTQSGLISRVLSPAVGLWLRSQLDHVEGLDLKIEAGDRQLLAGTINQVSAAASQAVYQGIHLSQLRVTSQHIQTNLRQVMRGQPFRLLAPFPICGTIQLSQDDFNASLAAPLLSTAIADFVLGLIFSANQRPQDAVLQNSRVEFKADEVHFTSTLLYNQRPHAIALRTQLTIANGNLLTLAHLHCFIQPHSDSFSAAFPDHLTFNLGAEVTIVKLSIQNQTLLCRGQVTVTP
jgi:LmeA-like phospholipid-binding